MRKLRQFLGIFAALVFSASAVDTVTSASPATAAAASADFSAQYEAIAPNALPDNLFKLVGEDFTVVTAGKNSPNSMTAGWGGFGILFDKPTAWLSLRASRFTLEKIRADGAFTLAYFAPQYQADVLFFGSKSGRDSAKMQESKLTPIFTPDGLPAYAEARLIFECQLLEITTVSPDDFFTAAGRKFIEDGYADAKDYHKLVFGEIVKVWRKK